MAKTDKVNIMSEVTEIIEGLIVPLLTPVDEEERIDEPALRALIRHCIEGGADGHSRQACLD